MANETRSIMVQGVLWVFVIALGINLGAGLYEVRIVVPLWSRGVPATLDAGSGYGRVAVDAGVRFWAFVTPAAGLLAIAALVVGWRMPKPAFTWLATAAVAELSALAMTLLYFRPTVVHLFLQHGAGMPPPVLAGIVRRWVAWNWARVGLSLIAWCAALRALTLASSG
jgi:hypothetical protein